MKLPEALRQQVEKAVTDNVGSDSGDLFGTDEATKAVCEVFETWVERLGTVVEPGGGVFRVIVYRDLEFYPEVGSEIVRLRNPSEGEKG